MRRRALTYSNALRARGIGFEIVPGITAATAAAGLRLSLTRRGIARAQRAVLRRTPSGDGFLLSG